MLPKLKVINFNRKIDFYLIDAFVEFNDCPERDARIVFFPEHRVSLAGSGGAVHEDGTVEAAEQNVDQVLGGAWNEIILDWANIYSRLK